MSSLESTAVEYMEKYHQEQEAKNRLAYALANLLIFFNPQSDYEWEAFDKAVEAVKKDAPGYTQSVERIKKDK